MNIALKVGESAWFLTRSGDRVFAFNSDTGLYPIRGTTKGGVNLSWTLQGKQGNHTCDLVEHLPDCTGWDWKPQTKLQLIADQLRKEIDVLRGYSTFDEKKASCSRLEIIADELDAMEATK